MRTMKDEWKLLSLLLLFLLLFSLFPTTNAKSVIEPCNSSDSCTSLLSYYLPWDSKLSEIAYRFQVNISDILASNSIDPAKFSAWNQIVPAKSLVKVPISCPCVDGIRRSISTFYTVLPADTVDSISEGYGGLVSAEQIRSTNSINAMNPLASGQSLVIPLPCTCFSNRNNGATAVYMSYVVQEGDSLSSIGGKYGITVNNLEAINGLGQPQVDPGDILAIPLPACSSVNLNWYNESLIVPNGSFALTANNCIKCKCGTNNLNLQCEPSEIVASCSHLQCKGSNLFIGDVEAKPTASGCDVSACIYRGHSGRKIFRSLVNFSQPQCSGNGSHAEESPYSSPVSNDHVIPFLALSPSRSQSQSPSLSPFQHSASNPSVGIDAFPPMSRQSASSCRRILSQASYFGLLLLELAICFSLN